ncbi:MAG: FmdB family zinc ribbon protein [Dehalococcoidia bacterium]
MPLYEYYCHECGTKFELLRPMSRADDAVTCPSGHKGAERVLSVFSAVSKGAGGETAPIGGGLACDTCSSTSCSTCPMG